MLSLHKPILLVKLFSRIVTPLSVCRSVEKLFFQGADFRLFSVTTFYFNFNVDMVFCKYQKILKVPFLSQHDKLYEAALNAFFNSIESEPLLLKAEKKREEKNNH